MTIAETLFRLEQLDAELEHREAALRDAKRRVARNPELEAAEASLETLRAQEQKRATEQRTAELDLADVEAKIKRDQTRMYSGEIVDARELASLEKELEQYRVRRDTLEERCLTLMEQADQLQSQMDETSRRANQLRETWEGDHDGLAHEIEQMTDALAGMRAEREQMAASVDPRSLDLYRRLRVSSGHAISHVSNGVCQWCRVVVPPKDVQHARGDQLVTCTNCARILYVGG